MCLTGKPPLLADGHVEGNFNKKEDKQTVVADTTNVKADKEATSIKHEKTKTEEVKKKKESTLLKQIGFACICVPTIIHKDVSPTTASTIPFTIWPPLWMETFKTVSTI